MSEECLMNAQDLTKSQKHESISDSPTWIQEMLAHLKRKIRKSCIAVLYLAHQSSFWIILIFDNHHFCHATSLCLYHLHPIWISIIV